MTPTARSTVGLSMATVFVGIPLVYYGYVELIRASEVRRRRKRYAKYLAKLEASSESQLIEPEALASEAVMSQALSTEHHHEIKQAFASFVVGGRYSNPFPEWREAGAWEWLWWKLVYQPMTGRVGWNGGYKDAEELKRTLDIEVPDFDTLFGRSNEKEETAQDPMTYTWIGQSTSYIQVDGISFLTDPVFADRTIDSFIAPPRLRPPPCALDDLPPVDIVLVSHSHFDHLHPDVIIALGNSVTWFVPLGLTPYLSSLGVTNVREMDWWESTEISVPSRSKGEDVIFDITIVPAMHWTARSVLDTNQSLWCSYIVKAKSGRSFAHIGDTGYSSELYKAIGRVSGGVDFATIPIGAYEPRWHLSTQHVNPDDAVRIHQDIKSKRSVAVHWGTWALSDEHYLDPPKDLAIARSTHSIPSEGVFDAIPPGRTIIIG